MFEPLKLGNRVEMVFPVKSGSDDTIEYASQILDFGDDSIICAMPIYEGHIVPLQEGKRFEGYFYSDNKIYRAACSVRSRGREDNLHIVEVELDSALIRVQRREYFRLSCIMPATLSIVTGISKGQTVVKDNSNQGDEQETTIVDISGGGIRTFSKIQYEKDDKVLIHFTLHFNNYKKEKNVLGRIVESFKNTNDDSMYDNRIQFIDISDSDRDEIVKYVFEQQRNILKKELGYNG